MKFIKNMSVASSRQLSNQKLSKNKIKLKIVQKPQKFFPAIYLVTEFTAKRKKMPIGYTLSTKFHNLSFFCANFARQPCHFETFRRYKNFLKNFKSRAHCNPQLDSFFLFYFLNLFFCSSLFCNGFVIGFTS